jgi:hypothetical protein
MKISTKGSLVLLLALGFQEAYSLPTGWFDSLTTLVDASRGMAAALVADVQLYKNRVEQINTIESLIEANKTLRESTFSCVTESFNSLVKSLEACQSSAATMVAQGIETVNGIIAQILALKDSTDNEITLLCQKRACLEIQFNQVKSDLESDLGVYREDAQKLLEELNDLRTKFDTSIAERKAFSDKVAEFLEKVDLEAKVDHADHLILNKDVCSVNDPKATDAYSSPEIPAPNGLTCSSVPASDCVAEEFIVSNGSCQS